MLRQKLDIMNMELVSEKVSLSERQQISNPPKSRDVSRTSQRRELKKYKKRSWPLFKAAGGDSDAWSNVIATSTPEFRNDSADWTVKDWADFLRGNKKPLS